MNFDLPHIRDLAQRATTAATVRLTPANREQHLALMAASDEAERLLIEAMQDETGGVGAVVLALLGGAT